MDPTIWIAFSTLLVIEIVLGIDNIVFITILAEKLPPQSRDKARFLGLTLALLMRIVLLMLITVWLVTLTTPLFTLFNKSFNARQLIILLGGIFLLFKATMELNEKLEGQSHEKQTQKKTSKFWIVVAQIVILDAVFSIDSVLTAIAITDKIPIMIAAVSIAIVIMMFASKPLAQFVNSHPTTVILCLSFLLLIGFSLVAEGFGFHIPKEYLYAAIGFSILIEFFNQLANLNKKKFLNSKPFRQRTADAILSLLKGDSEEEDAASNENKNEQFERDQAVFNAQELGMVERVLSLAQRSVSSIMTSRQNIKMLNINDDPKEILNEIIQNQHTRLIVTDDASIDEPIGVIQVNDLLKQVLNDHSQLSIAPLIKSPLIFPETISLLVALEQFKNGKAHFSFVVDEFGSMQGVVSVTDVIETIAGDFPTEGEDIDVRHDITQLEDGSWIANGYIPLEELIRYVPLKLDDKREYHTLAGLLMEQSQRIPAAGEEIRYDDYVFIVLKLERNRIIKVKMNKTN